MPDETQEVMERPGWRALFAAAFVLTLVTWIFFYVTLPDAPLHGKSTTVVFAIWFLLTALARRLWRTLPRLGRRA